MATASAKKDNQAAQPADIDPRSAIDSFLAMSDVDIVLTYGFAPRPIVFHCRLIMNDDELAARQKFYKQPDADQAAGAHKYHVEMLASIAVAPPEGLPGFEKLLAKLDRDPSVRDIGILIRTYFEKETPLSKKIAAEAVDSYVRTTSPAEFFR